MQKFIFLIAILTLVFSCNDEADYKKDTGHTLYKEILPIGRTDTTLIRFLFENEGNSKITGKVICSKDTMKSSSDYFKASHKPLLYYFHNNLELFDKNVLYYQVDSLTLDTFRIKITFPDYIIYVNNIPQTKKDSLVYKAFKYNLP